jgi:hypothetical protein
VVETADLFGGGEDRRGGLERNLADPHHSRPGTSNLALPTHVTPRPCWDIRCTRYDAPHPVFEARAWSGQSRLRRGGRGASRGRAEN